MTYIGTLLTLTSLATAALFCNEKSTTLRSDPQDYCMIATVTLAKPIDTAHLPAYCGIVMSKANYEYKVLKVDSGMYSKNFLNIEYSCPREMIEGKYIAYGTIKKFMLKRKKVLTTGPDGKAVWGYGDVFEIDPRRSF